MCTCLHVEGYFEGAARDIVFLGEGLHGEDDLTDVALAVHGIIDAGAVEGEFHVEHGRATSVEGAKEVSVAIVTVDILQRQGVNFACTAVPGACLHRLGATGVGQLVEVGAHSGAAYPAVGHTGILRHVVGGGDGHGEAVVRVVVVVAGVAEADLMRIVTGGGCHLRRFGQQ